jgi:hypothetical protein
VEANDNPKDNNNNSAHNDGIEKGSASSQRNSRRIKNMGNTNMGNSMRMLYSGHTSADELATPDLDDQESDLEEFAEDNGEDDEAVDDAEVVRDELADLEGLIQAAKGVGVS